MSFFAPAASAAKPKQTGAPREKPWVEKYRPKNVDEVAMQDEVVSVLKNCIEGGDMPHMLFYGPPGTGKTSTILAVCRQLFGTELMKSRVLELNASDERGIKVVREKVKNFAQLTAGATAKRSSSGAHPCPAFKIIIMDECDSMTNDAQSALRRTMEAYSKVTRFCLICNYVSRIIDPLASRCAKFRFKPLSTGAQMTTLQHIQKLEHVKCSSEVLDRLVDVSGGDMRQAITMLQCSHRLNGGEEITTADVEDAAGCVPGSVVENLIAKCHSNNYENMQTCVRDIVASGYATNLVLSKLHNAIVTAADGEINDIQKSRIAERLAQADAALIDGADEHLQLLDVGACIMKELSGV